MVRARTREKMNEEFSIHNKELLQDRLYYTDIPKHVLLVPDGSRRYARREGLTDLQVYDIAQQKCQEFLEVCFNEFDIGTASIFLLRPTSFDLQRRTNENLEAILNSINKLTKKIIYDEESIYKDGIDLRVISKTDSWMEKPQRIEDSQRLSVAWNNIKNSLVDVPPLRLNQKSKKINLLINYSGKAELDYAISAGNDSRIDLKEPIGLAIRTGEGMRISDGPLYCLSEAHFHLIPKYLPETAKDDFRDVLNHYFKPR